MTTTSAAIVITDWWLTPSPPSLSVMLAEGPDAIYRKTRSPRTLSSWVSRTMSAANHKCTASTTDVQTRFPIAPLVTVLRSSSHKRAARAAATATRRPTPSKQPSYSASAGPRTSGSPACGRSCGAIVFRGECNEHLIALDRSLSLSHRCRQVVPFEGQQAPSARRGRNRPGQHARQEARDRQALQPYGVQVADRLIGCVNALTTAAPSGGGGGGAG